MLLTLAAGLVGGGEVGDQVEGRLPIELKENAEGSLSPSILDLLVGFKLLTIKICIY